MKIAVLLGSLVIGGVLAAVPLFRNGFAPSALGEWLINTFFIFAVLSFIGMKFLVNEPTRPSSSSPNKRKKK